MRLSTWLPNDGDDQTPYGVNPDPEPSSSSTLPTKRTAHAKLAPSSAYRWSVCTASSDFIAANQESGVLPKETSSKYADEGTEAHEFAAVLLADPEARLEPFGEMADHVQNYVAFVRSKIKPGDRVYIERKVSLFYSPEETGTVDVLIVRPGRVIVIDLKYGVGVSVIAIENKQLSIYAESAIRELEEIEDIAEDSFVELYIYQPRDRSDLEPVREWIISRGFLAEFVRPLDEASAQIKTGVGLTFIANPDKQCRFCPAAGICTAYANYGLVAIDATIETLPAAFPDPHSLTREQRVKVILAKKGLNAWLESVEDQEMSELLGGAKPIGCKLVEGKSNRQWSDEEAIEKLLRNYLPADEVRPPGEVLSPAQAEKALKGKEVSTKFQNKFDALVVKPPGKPSLVPEFDPRPMLQITGNTDGLRDVSQDDCV